MRDTMNIITRLRRTINERLDAMAEESSRLSSSQPELRRSTTQLDPKRKKDNDKTKKKSHKERRTEELRRKSQDHIEDSPEESLVEEPFSEAPPLPPHLARLYETE
ncbi:hypothetical protein Taro_039430 [Colocasia esculenta]|uniref:Uncharacterized protein n=1 Tax=Colocasia esculenta TaxID=4460 RepID=A0A843WRI9_COLES|nr:hypothetical protein [Colocasia esculenta]